MIVVVMGVAGSGKTTIGNLLAARLGCVFVDADSYHPAANVEKMSQGIPLTDADRAPWLEALHDRILESWQRRESLVVACSALKQKYREQLARGVVVSWVFLKGTADVIRARLQERPQHFMKAGMLESQLAALEEPKDAIVADVTLPPDAIVERIARALMTSVPG